MSYYDLKISGKDVKRFIRNLYKMHISFYNIKYLDKAVIIRVNQEDYLKIKNIKTIYEIEIVKYYGIAKYNNFINKYKLFLIILVIGFIFFLGLTNIIFSVSINTDNQELKELVSSSLEDLGIKKYNFCVSYNKKEKIKEKILTKYNDKIEWMEIKRIGTRYEIELEERKQKEITTDNTPKNIVAKKNGVITKINAKSGEVVGRVGQYVKKGDVLISGTIHKNEDIVDNIKADGEVYAETWYTVSVELPYHYLDTKKTGKSLYDIKFSFLNKDFRFFKFKNFTTYDSKDLYSIRNTFLPVSFSIEKQEETEVKEEVNSLENAYFKASDIAKNKLYESLSEDISIIFEKKLKTNEINSKIEVVIFYKVIEDITLYQDINLDELDKREVR